ncbi:MAG TPA: undecaprenyl-diphosphate phosphatase [Acidimicrobiales bacterium]
MSIVHAIVLGIVQGVAEYMPISSSGHLILVPWLFGWDDFAGDDSLRKAFDVALHAGTLVGAVAYFRSDIVRLSRAAVTTPRRGDGRLGWLILLSALPAAVIGAVFAGPIERNTDEVWLVAVMLIVGALALAWADGVLGKRTIDEIRIADAAAMSIGQALALQPGVSRSGVTMTIGRYMGLGRDAAVRFAFLMSIPITAGALAYKAVDVAGDGGVPADMRSAFLWGIVSSAVTGYVAVWGMLRIVTTRSFAPFVVYRLVVGLSVLAVLATPFR